MSNSRCSLVIPFYQEADCIASVVPEACEAVARLDPTYEAILVNDGSTDGTAEALTRIATHNPHCRIITLPINLGQAAALLAGLQQSCGELILTMDGDGQNDPRDFQPLMELLERQHLDVACGWRRDRHDNALRRVMSRLANLVRSRVLGDGLHDAGCQLRVFHRPVIASLLPSPLMQAFLPAMAVAAGLKVGELPVRHHARRQGASKYHLGNLWWRPFAEMLRLRRLLHSTKPNR